MTNIGFMNTGKNYNIIMLAPLLGMMLISATLFGQETQITSNHTSIIDYSVKVNGSKDKRWAKSESPKRVTIFHTGEVLDLDADIDKSAANVKWRILKGTETYMEFYEKNPPPITFYRSKNEIGRKTPYTAELYIDDELQDQLSFFVINKLEFPFQNSFETPFKTEDDIGRKKIAKYPTFSDDYINRSCGGSYPEHINGKSVFTTYHSTVSRDGDGGSMAMTSPAAKEISSCRKAEWKLHTDSRVKRNDVNFYPHLKPNEDNYYAISLLIPNDDRFPTEFLDSYYNILFEFHQDHHLDKQLSTGGSAPMHLILTKDSNGKEIFRINYGIEQWENGAKMPINKLKAVDIPYERGKWIDVIFHVRWKQMFNNEVKDWQWSKDGKDGLFEAWYRMEDDDEYQKLKLGTPSKKAWAPFTYSADSTTLYGPNLENFNPTYITFNQYRLPRTGTNVKEVPYSTTVYFDRFRIAKSFEEVKN